MKSVSMLLALTVIVGCENRHKLTERGQLPATESQRAEKRDWANELVAGFVYVYEPRAEICYAYVYETRNKEYSYATGGPALAAVDCASVRDLILNPPPSWSALEAPADKPSSPAP